MASVPLKADTLAVLVPVNTAWLVKFQLHLFVSWSLLGKERGTTSCCACMSLLYQGCRGIGVRFDQPPSLKTLMACFPCALLQRRQAFASTPSTSF